MAARCLPGPADQRRHLAGDGRKQACAAGADLINDTWGGADPGLPALRPSSARGWSVRTPAARCREPGPSGSATERRAWRRRRRHRRGDGGGRTAVAAGVARDAILIDPTHDFGKNTHHGLSLLRHVKDLVNTGWPVLMALCNKDFVGETLGVGLTERLEGTSLRPRSPRPRGRACSGRTRWGPRARARNGRVDPGERPPTRTVRGLA